MWMIVRISQLCGGIGDGVKDQQRRDGPRPLHGHGVTTMLHESLMCALRVSEDQRLGFTAEVRLYDEH